MPYQTEEQCYESANYHGPSSESLFPGALEPDCSRISSSLYYGTRVNNAPNVFPAYQAACTGVRRRQNTFLLGQLSIKHISFRDSLMHNTQRHICISSYSL